MHSPLQQRSSSPSLRQKHYYKEERDLSSPDRRSNKHRRVSPDDRSRSPTSHHTSSRSTHNNRYHNKHHDYDHERILSPSRLKQREDVAIAGVGYLWADSPHKAHDDDFLENNQLKSNLLFGKIKYKKSKKNSDNDDNESDNESEKEVKKEESITAEKSKKSHKKKKHKKEKKKKQKKNKKTKRRSSTSSSSSSSSSSSESAIEAIEVNIDTIPELNKNSVDLSQLTLRKAKTKKEIEEIVGPSADHLKSQLEKSNKPIDYGKALLPGEGEAMAKFVQEGKRIPRRGEIGLTSEEIKQFEDCGYVMSGSRHRRMEAVRLRKENQVYSADEKRALATFNREARDKKEGQLMTQFRELIHSKQKS